MAKSNSQIQFLKKLMDPKASKDLNAFLEKLPHNAGQASLIAAGIAWSFAAALGLFTTIQVQNLTVLRAELKEIQALKPIVPSVKDVRVKQSEIVDFVENGLKPAYEQSGLNIRQDGASISIKSTATSSWGAFREAIGHVQNGGVGWRVSVKTMCVGRECDRDKLSATLEINKVSVDKPG